MITERNMIFANPQAYRVFPNIGNPMNTSITEQAIYQGYLQVTDSTGKTQSFTGTSTIDFTGFSGYVDIDQYSDVGSVKLGRWNIISNTPVEPVLPGQKTFAESTAADYVLYDKVNDEKICVEYGTDLSNYSSEQYTPIGVVVVPGTHDVYGDGSCGVMSLKEINYNSPDSGSTFYQYIYWGGYGDDTSLPNLDQVSIGNTSNSIPTGQNSDAYLPSDKFSGIQCAHDTDVSYYSTSSTPIPSPYLTDGSRNPGYYQTSSPSSSRNASADFDGIGNSQVLWDLATSQSDWKTASSITNTSGSGYYPAACCCWRYHTEGTKQGDWYLPACGELGYIMPPFNKINDAIAKMRTAYDSSVGVELHTDHRYWSSTEYSSGHARYVYASNGHVRYDIKRTSNYVRAFLRVADDTQEQPIEEYEYVDLGLPSGLLWAKKNIGADTEEDAGLYFQWGDTVGYTADQVGEGEGQKYFGQDDYKFSIDDSSDNYSKYNEIDGKTVLDFEDDAAHVIMGSNWRMPTFEECKELFENTDVYLVQVDDKEVLGIKVQDDEDGYILDWDGITSTETFKGMKFYKKNNKGIYLFISASGSFSKGLVKDIDEELNMWSSSLDPLSVRPPRFYSAWNLGFDSREASIANLTRIIGCPIRGVLPNNNTTN